MTISVWNDQRNPSLISTQTLHFIPATTKIQRSSVLVRSDLCRVTGFDDMLRPLGEEARSVVASLRTKGCRVQPEIQSQVAVVLNNLQGRSRPSLYGLLSHFYKRTVLVKFYVFGISTCLLLFCVK